MSITNTSATPHAATAPQSEYLSHQQAAKYLNISATTLYHWRRAGLVASIKMPIGKAVRFRKSDLDAVMSAHATTAIAAE